MGPTEVGPIVSDCVCLGKGQLVTVQVSLPEQLSPEQAELFRQFSEASGLQH